MKYLVAVSGGIDSVVLLDMFVGEHKHDIIVAHFDHGIREDSAHDARFVEALARKYRVPFVTAREELGSGASEDTARRRRYAFLRRVADEHEAMIVTAHHGDDIIETVAINLTRGTGWRGLAVLDSENIYRPLLAYTKPDIRAYALNRRLEWVEDSTNASARYLRNRLRQTTVLHVSNTAKQALWQLRRQQVVLKAAIDAEAALFVQPSAEYSRHFFTQLDSPTAYQLLRSAATAASGTSPTRPQLERALLSIKTARAHTQHEVNGRTTLRFTTRTFIVQTP